jgi:hypothetical protein
MAMTTGLSMMEAKTVTVDTADTTGDVDDDVCGQSARAVTTVGAGEQGAGNREQACRLRSWA